MLVSTLTSKGQTTIPKEVREFLHLSPEDKILYVFDPQKKQVMLIPVTGTVLGLRGIVPHEKGRIDFKELRKKTRRIVGSSRSNQ